MTFGLVIFWPVDGRFPSEVAAKKLRITIYLAGIWRESVLNKCVTTRLKKNISHCLCNKCFHASSHLRETWCSHRRDFEDYSFVACDALQAGRTYRQFAGRQSNSIRPQGVLQSTRILVMPLHISTLTNLPWIIFRAEDATRTKQ